MKVLTNRNQLAGFFRAQLGTFYSDDFRGIAMYREGEDELTVAVAYNAFVGRTCSMHVVIRKSLTREMIRAAFDFPFKQCGCEAVLVQIDSMNERSLKFCEKIGFKSLAVIPSGGLEGNLVVMWMSKQDWLESKYGQEVTTATA